MVEKLRIINKDGSLHYIRFDLKNNTINYQEYVQTVIIDITADVLKDKEAESRWQPMHCIHEPEKLHFIGN